MPRIYIKRASLLFVKFKHPSVLLPQYFLMTLGKKVVNFFTNTKVGVHKDDQFVQLG